MACTLRPAATRASTSARSSADSLFHNTSSTPPLNLLSSHKPRQEPWLANTPAGTKRAMAALEAALPGSRCSRRGIHAARRADVGTPSGRRHHLSSAGGGQDLGQRPSQCRGELGQLFPRGVDGTVRALHGGDSDARRADAGPRGKGLRVQVTTAHALLQQL